MKVFVTVGTTKFDELIQTVTSQGFLSNLKVVKEIIIQCGHSPYQPIPTNCPIKVKEIYDFKKSLKKDMEYCDLIVTAGGSGTILEALEMGKRLLVVPNSTLQDNHQLELVNELEKQNYIMSTTISRLSDSISDQRKLKKWKSAGLEGSKKIVNILMEM
jgi:beta-1,4-N-acetylglucosaminyltransferase